MTALLSLILFTSDPWESAMPVIRVTAPASAAHVAVLRGNEGGQVFLERIPQADLVIIQRDFPHQAGYAEVVECARMAGKPVVYELDDLLFELPADHISYDNHLISLLPMLAAAVAADAVVTSSPPLKEYLSQFNPRTRCVPNLLDDRLWSLKSTLSEGSHEPPVVIGYMGGQTHLHDLETIAPVLLSILERYGDQIRLRFWGGAPPDELRAFAQVEWQSLDLLNYQQFAAYFSQQTCDFFIAPLRDNRFNQCKSAIKFLEYSALGIPGIYSRVGPYNEIVRPGMNGVLAGDPEEWQAHLVELIANPHLRFEMGQQALLTLRREGLLSVRVGECLAAYQEILDVSGEPSPPPLSPALQAISRASGLQKKLEEIIAQQQKSQSEVVGEFRKLEAVLREEQAQRVQLAGQLIGVESQRVEIETQLRESAVREQHLSAVLNERTLQLNAVINSRSWRALLKIQSIRRAIIPSGSALERVARKVAKKLLSRQALPPPPAQPAVQPPILKLPRELSYPEWIQETEPGSGAIAAQVEAARQLPHKLLFSLLAPVTPGSAGRLDRLVQGVIAQTYPDWELFLVYQDAEISGKRAGELAGVDARIHPLCCEHVAGMADALNQAAENVHGDFLIFVMQDDILAPFALFEIARQLDQPAGWDVLYSDHDEIDGHGSRISPFFKPDWSPDLLLSTDYCGSVMVTRKTTFPESGLFNPALGEDYGWDGWLRLSLSKARVGHISKILYHHLVHPQLSRSVEAVRLHLARLGLDEAEVRVEPDGNLHARWKPSATPRVSIIIPSRGASPMLEGCVASILEKTDYPDYEILIINNGDQTPDRFPYYQSIQADSRVRVLHFEGPFNYSTVNNFGAQHASGELLLFLNNDTQVIAPDWLAELATWACRPEIGAVGAQLTRPDGSLQHAGVIVGLSGFAGHIFADTIERSGLFGSPGWYRDYLAVTAACMMVRKQVFVQLGGFNPEFLLCGGDVEYGLRSIAAGYRVVYNPFARLLHIESATHQGIIPANDFKVSYQYYLPYLKSGDPFFNCNLSYSQAKPCLRKPGEISPLDFVLNYIKSI
jgi:GT2 family glycosyltransferase/glycosyltransferase involved in cell wall biosynthesis